MMSYFRTVCLASCLLISNLSQGQIGNRIPSDRLPGGSTILWQEAGCPFLDEPVQVSAFFNVMEYGALGNGQDDDTEAVTHVLELAGEESAAGGFSIVYLPAGTFKITQTLTVPSRTVVKGDGSDASILYFHHDEHAMLYTEVENSGLEDIKLTRKTDQVLNKYYIRMGGVSNGWIRGVETEMANSNHIMLSESDHLFISGCYIHGCTDHGGGGNGYGIVIGNETHSTLIEDNIFRDARHSIVTGGLCHWNVIGFNASYDPHTSTSGGLGEWVTGDIQIHGNSSNPGPQMGAYENLFEGNYFNWIWVDAYWGDNGDYNTFFRNIARKGGLVLEDYYESVNGGNHYNCNDNQTFVNNYLENIDIATKIRYGAPWGDGYLKSSAIGGSGHFAKNNKVYEILFPSLSIITSWKADGEQPEFLEDTSYYYASRPDFIPEEDWPFDAFDTETRNPAAERYESGGLKTVKVGFSPYILTSIEEPLPVRKCLVYPNPTTGKITLRYQLPDARYLIIGLYNEGGREIRTLMQEKKAPGVHEMSIDLSGLPQGIYFIKIKSGNQQLVRKVEVVGP